MTYEDLKQEWLNASPTITCRTSGSTGSPTEINLPKVQMINSARRTCRFFNIYESSRLHSCISPEYIGGKMMWIRTQVAKCDFSYEIPSNRILHNYSGAPIDLVAVVPSQMVNLLNEKTTLPPVNNYLIGGAAIPDSLRKKIVERGIPAWESYGMTETSSHIALRPIVSEEVPFQTLPGIKVGISEEGRLCITIDGWKEILTNDLATLYSPDSFIITGRKDNVINSGGKKINPENLEKKLSSILKFDFAISSLPDPVWGEKVVLALVASDCDEKIVINHCSSICQKYEVPKEIIKISRIPMTENGKIARHALRGLLVEHTRNNGKC